MFVDQLRKRRAVDEAHRVVDLAAVGLADVVDWDDRRVLELRRHSSLVPESPKVGGRRPLEHELEGDVTAKARIEGAIHHTHSAATQLGLDQVPPELGA